MNSGNVSPIKKGRSFFRHSWRANGETKHREAQRSGEGPREMSQEEHDNTDPTPLSTGAGTMTPAASEECHEERVEVAPATRRWWCHFESECRDGRNQNTTTRTAIFALSVQKRVALGKRHTSTRTTESDRSSLAASAH